MLVQSAVPRVKAEPDFENILAVLRREVPTRPTLFEFFLNAGLYSALADEPFPTDTSEDVEHLHFKITAFRNAGYDYATWHASSFRFPNGGELGGFRAAGKTLIDDRESFEAYPWPDPADSDYSLLEKAEKELPANMKLIIPGPGGLLENIIQLVGFEDLSYLIADDEELIQEIFDAIGSRLVKYYEIAAPAPAAGALIVNDDWGFKTQPMLSPDNMRQFVIPWHKKMVDVIHAAGKPAILHSCGNQEELYDDIIDTIGFDAKHSYEDIIQPVEEAYEQIGSRIAVLGGIDLDFVCRSTPEEVYRRSKAILEQTAERGGYALGTGNSVPDYVPDENYFAMLRAATEDRL